MTRMPIDNAATEDLLQHVQRAREQYASGAGTVLDVLLREEPDANTLDDRLRAATGIAAIVDAQAARPDWLVLPLDEARRLGAIALTLPGEDRARIAVADPWDDACLRPVVAAIGRWPLLAAPTGDVLQQHLGPGAVPVAAGIHEPESAVVAFVDSAILRACDSGASDVHFECDRQGLTVKLRQDGVMVQFARMDTAKRAEEAISRIKVMAQLDITERRTPQDGRVRWTSGRHTVDLRVSIMPSIHGEDAVLRLLDKAQLRRAGDVITLDSLGFDDAQAASIRTLSLLPHGMLLVTGPTGSGKTTTLYAVLSEINTGLEKIITIEDPVEYELAGVLQIPVNERKGLTFAKGLRSILRHDPDRILVGEIRDAETAEIAIQSALTGHQVFTTVHANSISDVTGRFRHFGLDMFGFMASLNGVVVQRLVRQLCRHCAGVRAPSDLDRRWFASMALDPRTVPVAVGCQACQGTGYRGRRAIAEIHVVDDALRDLVTEEAPVSALKRHIEQGPMPALAACGARLVLQGLTTVEELRRVVGGV